MGKHGFSQGGPLSSSPLRFPSNMNSTLHKGRLQRSWRVTFKTGKPHTIYLSKSLNSVLKGYYKSRRYYFKWVLLLSKPWRPCPQIRERTESCSRPQLSDRHSQSFLYLLLTTALILVRIFLPEPWGTGGGEVKDSTVQLSFGIRTKGTRHKRERALLFTILDIICIMDRGRKLSVCCVFTLVLPINSGFLCEWIAGTGPGLMDKQCFSA